jgi:hypothetical protein
MTDSNAVSNVMSEDDRPEALRKESHVHPDRKLGWNPENLDTPVPTHGAFESRGDGLTCYEYPRANIAGLKRTVTTQKIPVTTPMSKTQRRKWWAAQVKLYGLVCTSWDIDNCIKVLCTALADGLEDVPEYIAKKEKQLNDEFVQRKLEEEDKRRTLFALRQETYNNASTDVEKAIIDPRRFLTEREGQVTVLRGVQRENESMKHVCKIGHEKRFDVKLLHGLGSSVMIIGKMDDVNAEIDRISPEIQAKDDKVRGKRKAKRRRAEKRCCLEEEARTEAQIEKRAAVNARHEELVRTGGGGGDTDITGNWYLEIEELDALRVEKGDFYHDEHGMEIAAP